MKKALSLVLFIWVASHLFAQSIPLVSNIYNRQSISLDGKWHYIVDPLENGYYDYRLKPLKNGYFKNQQAKNSSDLVEYNFSTSPTLYVPGDWNTQSERLFFYEGTIWYEKDFTINIKTDKHYIIYFGAANYETKVWVNGTFVGEHVGGYSPFNFDITKVLKSGNNFVVVKVDDKRQKDNVPTVNMDWWNYGGLTRNVLIAELPKTYIEDYSIQIDKHNNQQVEGWIKLNDTIANQNITLRIPELKIEKRITTNNQGIAKFSFKAKPELWCPEKPKLYTVNMQSNDDDLNDEIGFRNITTKGKQILLNGKPIFLRGISIHEEAPYRQGRAWSEDDARTLLTWAKDMGCNYVRLAHYPHNETMVRTAEKMGIMVWSEIPVYWTISWDNPKTYANAQNQLHDMIYRDKNRANVIIWSIANETPHSDARDRFLSNLAKYARTQDTTRLISMAMEITHDDSTKTVNMEDNMNKYVDIVSFNEYMGWYWGNYNDWTQANWHIPYNKPVVISEMGGGALQGLHGDKTQRWTEEYQAAMFKANLEMLERIDGLAGMSPWILVDFRSPRRQLNGIQDYFNRKGLISDRGIKKEAYYVMQKYYQQKSEKYKH